MPDAISMSLVMSSLPFRLLAGALVCLLCAQPLSAQRHFGVMTYNCENAFDTLHDAGRNDYEFLPDGKRKWTRWKFHDKLRKIGKVILATDTIQPVDIVCLCEVENDTVMTYLTQRTMLRNIGYEYVMTCSDDKRGLDVALMYQPHTFRLVETQTLRAEEGSATRDVLRVAGVLQSGDTLDVYAVHLPSKLGGAKADRLRTRIAERVRSDIDSLMAVRTSPCIVLMGDFNDSPKSKIMRKALRTAAPQTGSAADGRTQWDADVLYNLMADKPQGTYKYKGVWTMIDQIVVNGNLLIESHGLHTTPADARVVRLPFLLEEDKTHKGDKPRRSFLGTFYGNGFSDHLPVYVKFNLSSH